MGFQGLRTSTTNPITSRRRHSPPREDIARDDLHMRTDPQPADFEREPTIAVANPSFEVADATVPIPPSRNPLAARNTPENTPEDTANLHSDGRPIVRAGPSVGPGLSHRSSSTNQLPECDIKKASFLSLVSCCNRGGHEWLNWWLFWKSNYN